MYMYRIHENLELNRELMAAQGKLEDFERIRPYTGSVRCQKDIESLSRGKYSTAEISNILQVPESLVKSRIAIRQREDEERRQFLSSGILPKAITGSGSGYYAILQK
jgi:hypothetical protein